MKPEFFVLPWRIYHRCKAYLDSMGCPVGYEFVAKPNVITWVADIFLSVICHNVYCTMYSSVATSELFLSLFLSGVDKSFVGCDGSFNPLLKPRS